MSVQKEVLNILFCILQDSDRENRMNESLFDAQTFLYQQSCKGVAIEKAFVYGNKYNHIKSFGEVPVEQVRFVRYSITKYDIVQGIVSAFNLLKEKALMDECKGISTFNSLVFLSNYNTMGRINNALIEKIFPAFKDMDIHLMLIQGERDEAGHLEYYIRKKEGRVYTNETFHYAVERATDWKHLFLDL